MRTWSLFGAVCCTTLLFIACTGGGNTSLKPTIDSGIGDGGRQTIDTGSAIDSRTDTTEPIDASVPNNSDGALGDGAPGDGAPGDAASEGGGSDDGGPDDGGGEDSAPGDGGVIVDASDASGPSDAGSATSTTVFEEALGANTYTGGLKAGNWVASGTFITANSGTQWFGSGNGNASGSFPNLGLKKNLGGVVENRPYTVSFYVAQYIDGFSGIELSDFSVLRIGGPNGLVTWTSTPTPNVTDVWVQWTGTYAPALADVGGPFYFEAVFNLDALHTIGIDGPVVAIP